MDEQLREAVWAVANNLGDVVIELQRHTTLLDSLCRKGVPLEEQPPYSSGRLGDALETLKST